MIARVHLGLVVFACVAGVATLFFFLAHGPAKTNVTSIGQPSSAPHVPARPPAEQPNDARAVPAQSPSDLPNGAHDAPAQTPLAGRASVIDGDTITIHGTRIRLNGIDAPERGQTCTVNGAAYRCGQKAAMALSDFINTRMVDCKQTGTDRWRRVVARCFVDGTDIGEWMVREGWAIAYRKYSLDYVTTEEAARSERRGLFSGTFTNPEEWRKAKQNGEAYVRQ